MIQAASPRPFNLHQIAVAISATQDPQVINHGLTALEPFIRRMATVVAHRRGLDNPDEFAALAFGKVAGKLWDHKFDPGRETKFSTWLYSVLHNFAKDAGRRRRNLQSLASGPQASLLDVLADRRVADELSALDDRLDGPRRLSAADLQVIHGWDPAQRIFVLALSNLVHWVTPRQWESWKREAGCGDLPIIQAISSCRHWHDRYRAYGQLFGMETKSVSRQWGRHQVMILELEFVWDVIRHRVEPLSTTATRHVLQNWPSLTAIVLLIGSGQWIRLPSWRIWHYWSEKLGLRRRIEVLVLHRKRSLEDRLLSLGNHFRQSGILGEAAWAVEIWEFNQKLLADLEL